MKKIIFTLLLITIFSCKTTTNYNIKLNHFVGKTESDLIEQWGKPEKVHNINNNEQIITYVRNNGIIIPPRYSYFYPNFNDLKTEYTPFTYQEDFNIKQPKSTDGYIIKEYCQTSFHIKNGVIFSWQWKGNNCVAY